MPTTLQLLQAYPLGTLEVEIAAVNPLRGIVQGLYDINGAQRMFFSSGEHALWLDIGPESEIKKVRPYLRSFDQLCTPLEDGSVPAVEVAKMILTDWSELMWIGALADMDERDVRVVVPDKSPAKSDMILTLFNDWSDLSFQVADYLRSLHFALPLAGTPLVEGVDYIRKN